MTETPALHPAFAEAMELDRETLNQQFKWVAREHRIETAEFFRHLQERVNPVVAAVDELMPERSRVATTELFGVSLDLFAGSILGAESELNVMDRLWRQLLPTLARFVARAPQQVVGSLCNGLLQIYRQTPLGADQWLNRMEALSPICSSSQELLDAGKLLSWICGMAQFRIPALQLARRLDHDLLIKIFEVSDETTREEMFRRIEQWEQNPWSAMSANNAHSSHRVDRVATVGSFRGFDGPFLYPPKVMLSQGSLHVEDTQSRWQLYADQFGSYFHRIGEDQLLGSIAESRKSEPKIAKDGTVSWNGKNWAFPQLAHSNSSAFDGVTLAVTLPNSFYVFLLALVG